MEVCVSIIPGRSPVSRTTAKMNSKEIEPTLENNSQAMSRPSNEGDPATEISGLLTQSIWKASPNQYESE